MTRPRSSSPSPIGGPRFPDRPRERATRSTWALRAMVETPPWAAATLRNAFINSRGSPSDSSIAALRYAATSSGVRRYSLASWALTGMPLLLSVCLPDGELGVFRSCRRRWARGSVLWLPVRLRPEGLHQRRGPGFRDAEEPLHVPAGEERPVGPHPVPASSLAAGAAGAVSAPPLGSPRPCSPAAVSASCTTD